MKKHTGILCLFVLFTGMVYSQYCTPTYTFGTTDNDYIDGFELETISNLGSGEGDGTGYTDFTALSADLIAGTTYNIHIINTPFYGESYRAWIDYNHDYVFASDEEIFIGFNLIAGEETTESFTIPLSASSGATRLRIRCSYDGLDFDACTNENYGETEDYSIYINGLAKDLTLFSISDLPDACSFTTNEPISLTIKNNGTEDATGFSVAYTLDGGAPIVEAVVSTLPAGNSYTHNFATGADLSAEGPHTVIGWVIYDLDEYLENDTNAITIINTSTYLTTGFPENICYSGGTVFPSPIAGGGVWSGDGIIDPLTGELDPTLVGGVGASTDITYAFETAGSYTVTEIPYVTYFLADPSNLGLGDDDYADNLDIGFSFSFFGNTYNKLYISSNGFIGFSAGSGAYNNQHLPNNATPNNLIAMSWTDLNPGDEGSIYYEMQGTAPFRRFIVEYNNVAHYGGGGNITGQIILYETSNAIDFQITQIDDDGGDITQGIENISGTAAYVTNPLYNRHPFEMTSRGWRFAVTPCDATVTETINFIDAPVINLIDAEVCSGTIVTLDAGIGAENYIWSTGESTQTINVSASGNYWVIYFANITCHVSDTSYVIVNPLPVVNLGADGLACEGTMLDAMNPGSEYIWNNGITSQTQFITESGTYSVDVYNPITGCSNSDEITMTITPLPVASFTSTVVDALTIVFTNTSIDALTYYWDFSDGTISYEENPTHTFATAGAYNVQLIISSECGADIYSEVFQVTAILNLTDDAIKIYPNPANTFLHIELNTTKVLAVINIYNLQGELLSHKTANQSTDINTSQFASGDYMLVVEENANTICIPFVITK